jgi:vacuolar-type H+-ATPase subunit H
MDQDIFAEVKRIETEAEAVLTTACADRKAALSKARADAEGIRAESAEKLSTERRLMREEHESRLAKEKEKLDATFEQRRRRLAESAGSRIDELAESVVKRFLSQKAAT